MTTDSCLSVIVLHTKDGEPDLEPKRQGGDDVPGLVRRRCLNDIVNRP